MPIQVVQPRQRAPVPSLFNILQQQQAQKAQEAAADRRIEREFEISKQLKLFDAGINSQIKTAETAQNRIDAIVNGIGTKIAILRKQGEHEKADKMEEGFQREFLDKFPDGGAKIKKSTLYISRFRLFFPDDALIKSAATAQKAQTEASIAEKTAPSKVSQAISTTVKGRAEARKSITLADKAEKELDILNSTGLRKSEADIKKTEADTLLAEARTRKLKRELDNPEAAERSAILKRITPGEYSALVREFGSLSKIGALSMDEFKAGLKAAKITVDRETKEASIATFLGKKVAEEKFIRAKGFKKAVHNYDAIKAAMDEFKKHSFLKIMTLGMFDSIPGRQTTTLGVTLAFMRSSTQGIAFSSRDMFGEGKRLSEEERAAIASIIIPKPWDSPTLIDKKMNFVRTLMISAFDPEFSQLAFSAQIAEFKAKAKAASDAEAETLTQEQRDKIDATQARIKALEAELLKRRGNQ